METAIEVVSIVVVAVATIFGDRVAEVWARYRRRWR